MRRFIGEAVRQQKQWRLFDEWAEVPVGTEVVVTMDDGTEVATKVKSQATLLGGHTAVGWFEGIVGCYALERARRVT